MIKNFKEGFAFYYNIKNIINSVNNSDFLLYYDSNQFKKLLNNLKILKIISTKDFDKFQQNTKQRYNELENKAGNNLDYMILSVRLKKINNL